MAFELRPCAGEPQLTDPAVTGKFAPEMAAIAGEIHTAPWCGYVGWRDGTPLGFGGFKAAPDADRTVEIGYLTFPQHGGAGVATAIAGALIAIARAEGINAVQAHTLCEENASTGVLRRNGFVRDGESIDPDEGVVWRWVLNL